MVDVFRRACEKLAGSHARLLEAPPAAINADLALPCFTLGKNPAEKAAELAAAWQSRAKPPIARIEASGPYVNFYADWKVMGQKLVREIMTKKNYGAGKKSKELILIESPGPNTNKPLHLGHLRNMALGMSLARLLAFAGSTVRTVDIVNDRGVHICKSMLAYQTFGKGKKPDKKPDHFVGDYYVRFAKELEGKASVDAQLRAMLVAWEKGDPSVRRLWKQMNRWALDGFAATYKRFGMHIDKTYYESEHYLAGKKIVLGGMNKKIFTNDEKGNVIADLGPLGKRVLLRDDGTAVYLTQDIALAKERFKDFRMDAMIYVVGIEQKDHFKALFAILDKLGFAFAKRCHHLAYGMINLPEGKMKSREGTVVDADDLLDELHRLAAIEVTQRFPKLSAAKIEQRAEAIALAAAKFFILKYDAVKTFVYDPAQSIAFEGETGPYLLYTYARAKSILRKAKTKPKAGALGREEERTLKMLGRFPDATAAAAVQRKPHLVANYLAELAAAFNEYYHATTVIGSDREKERLALVAAVAMILNSGLALLGIETLEEM